MRMTRSELDTHLKHLFCGGHIGEVVLHDNWVASAITPDHQLVVWCEGGVGKEPLPDSVGVMDLGLLLRSIKMFGEDGDDTVDIDFKEDRIELSGKNQGTARLVTASPKNIGTRVEEGMLEVIVQQVEKDDGYALPQSIVEMVLKSVALVKADTITVRRRSGKNTVILIGSEDANHTETSLPKSKPRKGEGSYDLILDASIVSSVLGELSDFSASFIGFSGEESVIAIWDDNFTYFISPMEEED